MNTVNSADKGADFLENNVITNSDIEPYLKTDEVLKIKPAGEFREDVARSFLGLDEDKGDKLPWNKTTEFRFRPHEVTIWSGFNGSYKSYILGQVCLGLMSQGRKICIASPEMTPKQTLKRMIKQYSADSYVSRPIQDGFFDWVSNKFWLYNQTGSLNPKTILAVIRYCVDKLGTDHFILDSLMKSGIPEKDLDQQKWFIDELCTTAKDTGVHIHLVAHKKKPPSDGRSTGKYDIAGSANITNLADNVINVFKNDDVTSDKSYNLGLDVQKQRNYEGENNPEPKDVFWMHKKSIQFLEKENMPPLKPDDWQRS